MFTRVTMALMIGLALSAAAPQAQAADARLKVAVIHATKAKQPVDPALKKINASLVKAFGGYQGFKQLAKHDLELDRDQAKGFKLPNGHQAKVTYKGLDGKQHRIRLAAPKAKVDVDLKVPMNRMFYQAGMKHANGILILALYLKPI